MITRLIHPDLPLEFDLMEPTFEGGLQRVPTEDTEIQTNSDQSQLLAWHYRLGHLPFKRIQQLAIQGDLPIRLSKCSTPKCAACLYGKATRRAWRTRAPPNTMTTPPAISPGAVVSVDQMESAVPGLIAQMKIRFDCANKIKKKIMRNNKRLKFWKISSCAVM